MGKRDSGAIQKLFGMIVFVWIVICVYALMQVMQAGYISQYLEDVLTQADLSALLIDPYHYGATGELVFENAQQTKDVFEQVLNKGIGEEEIRTGLGIAGKATVLDFRIYEVQNGQITEMVSSALENWTQRVYTFGEEVLAPDGTKIETASIYAKIAVPVKFLFGIHMTAVREHCVDIVSEEMVYE